jgi:predicted nuclease of predicted toxin-antitoxin system
LGLNHAPDCDLLAYAKKESRTIVTADLDYPRLLALARTIDPSLILFRDGNWSDAEIIARMSEILRAVPPADMEQSIIVVELNRVRRRRLPISPG